MEALPVGIVTFLFTDIEGSTRLVQLLGHDYISLLETHSRILRSAIAEAGGTVVSTEGDSFFAVFATPAAALAAAVAGQRLIAGTSWPGEAKVQVRMGIHTGQGLLGGDNYAGLEVHRAARIAAVAHGGQIVVSQVTAALARDDLPTGSTLCDLGSHRLKDLARPEPLLQLSMDDLPSDFPALRSLDALPHNLPVQLTSFVGRDEVNSVLRAVEESRLVTLTGPGGTGKTRLSLQVAAELTNSFHDGVWFVALGSIREVDLVTPTVAATLGLQPSTEDPDQRLTEYLREKEILLVLDNFEQVVEAADRIIRWLQGAPGLKVLTSSRIPLRVSGETEYPVPPLPLPDPESINTPESLARVEAVQLFVERAQAVRPDFQLTAENAQHVAAVVARLDGLPLGIELAAARIKVLSPAALSQRLVSRLGLLTGGGRDLPERQRTLRGAIEWSYDLLDQDHRTLFNCLGAFGGSFGLEQGEAICGASVNIEILDGLTALVDHSLVRVVSGDGESRFVMLETIAELAREHLEVSPAAEDVRRRHAEVYLALAEEAAVNFTRIGQRSWLDRIALDHDNLRNALSWTIRSREADLSFGLVSALWRFWQMRGWLQEGRRLGERALALEGGSLARRRDALEAAGGMAYWQADEEAALAYYEEALILAEKVGDPARIADCLYNKVFSHGIFGYSPETVSLLERARSIAVDLGDSVREGTYEWGLGTSAFWVDDPAEALVHYDRAETLLEGTDAIFQMGWCHRMKGTCLLKLGRVDEAEDQLRRGLAIFAEAKDTSAFALHVRDFAELALQRQHPERALLLVGAAAALEAVSETRMLDFVANRLGDLGKAIEAVGPEKADKILAEGRSLSVHEILALVGDGS
ncbi:MAG TPA: adenylate/guanylate cyclase domain-containing protein [Acidimicrobiia bacterium]|nr:adenylate/guanylate cyclase domain-containing protein [Acidimicrobiia bacterium]